MMRYEDLREDPAAEIEQLAAFLGISVKPARIDDIVQLTTLERLKSQQVYDDPRKKHTCERIGRRMAREVDGTAGADLRRTVFGRDDGSRI